LVPQLIITHPGSAHFDEMTAISFVLASYPETDFKVERRDPSDAELDNPLIWVIDTGRRHEPSKRNFDHHQALECPASFVLVAQYLGLVESLSVLTWWNFKDAVDRIGPVRASADFKAGDDLVNRNPVEEWLVDIFAQGPGTALPLLRSLGQHIIQNARGLKKQIDFWQNARRLDIAGVPAVIGETRESFGLEEFRRLTTNPPDIVISLDRRGSDGWRLYRYDGAPVDFYRLVNYPEIDFAHKSGFLAKTRERLPLAELTKLIAGAVIIK
jgi:hypothetical protein